MDIDARARAPWEPAVSRNTALACLVQLGVQNGLDRALAAAFAAMPSTVTPAHFRGSSSSRATSIFAPPNDEPFSSKRQ